MGSVNFKVYLFPDTRGQVNPQFPQASGGLIGKSLGRGPKYPVTLMFAELAASAEII